MKLVYRFSLICMLFVCLGVQSTKAQLATLTLVSPDLSTVLPLDIGTEYTFIWSYNYLFTNKGSDVIDPNTIEFRFIPSDGATIISGPIAEQNLLSVTIKPNSEVFRIVVGVDDIEGNFTAKSEAFFTSSPITVPVEFVDVKATLQNKSILLEWSTAIELNNDRFLVERSVNGRSYSKLFEVRGAGYSQDLLRYRYIDEHPLNGLNYYRLKQIDFNGDFEYSPVVSTRYESDHSISIAPNPAQRIQRQPKLYFYNSDRASSTRMNIYDISGKIVYQNDFQIEEGQNAIHIPLESLLNGLYIVQLRVGAQTFNERLIVQ